MFSLISDIAAAVAKPGPPDRAPARLSLEALRLMLSPLAAVVGPGRIFVSRLLVCSVVRASPPTLEVLNLYTQTSFHMNLQVQMPPPMHVFVSNHARRAAAAGRTAARLVVAARRRTCCPRARRACAGALVGGLRVRALRAPVR